MNRIFIATISFFIVCAALTVLKQQVRIIDKKISRLAIEKSNLNDELDILNANWSLLNMPVNIEKLSSRFFDYHSVSLRGKNYLPELLASIRSQELD